LLLTFNCRTDDASLTYVAQVSRDAENWSSGPGIAELLDREPLGTGWERLTYRDLAPIVPLGRASCGSR